MALEAIAGLGLACNIVQLLDFVSKIAEHTQAFRKNFGELPKDLQRVEDLVNSLVPVAKRLQDASATSSDASLQDQSIDSLLSRCISEAQDFKTLLESFKFAGRSGWTSFIAALRVNRKAGKIQKIEEALTRYTSSLTLHIAEASFTKQDFVCELLNNNQQAQSQEAQTTSEALQRLGTCVDASFRNMEDNLHQIFQRLETTTIRAEKAMCEIEKLHADHAAWARERDALQQRHVSHLTSRPIIVQFQLVQRRKPQLMSRRSSRTVQSRMGASRSNGMAAEEEEAVWKRRMAISYINILISLPATATPGELMHCLKQILYTSWTEVTRRITAAIPVVYHMSDSIDGSEIDRDASSENTVLLSFLETHGKDDILTYDPARSTLTAGNKQHGLNMDITCSCDFYWKGFSTRPLQIDLDIPPTLSTLRHRPPAPEKANFLDTFETFSAEIPEEASKLPVTSRITYSEDSTFDTCEKVGYPAISARPPADNTKATTQSPVMGQISHARQSICDLEREGRRRRRRSNKAGRVFVQTRCIIPKLLVLLSLFFSTYSFLLHDVAVSQASTYTPFWYLRDYWLGVQGSK